MVIYIRNFQIVPPGTFRALEALLMSLAYFTIQSNLFVLGWNMTAVIRRFRGKTPEPERPFLRGAFCLYITVTCIVFALFIAPSYEPEGIVIPANLLLHFIIPAAFVLDWILTERPGRLRLRHIFIWLIYPLVYLVWALIFARVTDLYVYPFIDLSELGFPRFLLNVIGLAAFFAFLGGIYIGIDRIKYTRAIKSGVPEAEQEA